MRKRKRGEIEKLPSGSLRIKVYAGIAPLSGKRNYLTETVPAGPTAATDAERARTRLQSQVDERRSPRTKATVNQLLDRYLRVPSSGATRPAGSGRSKMAMPCTIPSVAIVATIGLTLRAPSSRR